MVENSSESSSYSMPGTAFWVVTYIIHPVLQELCLGDLLSELRELGPEDSPETWISRVRNSGPTGLREHHEIP